MNRWKVESVDYGDFRLWFVFQRSENNKWWQQEADFNTHAEAIAYADRTARTVHIEIPREPHRAGRYTLRSRKPQRTGTSMTTNHQRATEILNSHWGVAAETGMADETKCCVEALTKAGLLMPDLREPTLFDDGAKEWIITDGWINVHDGIAVIDYDEHDGESSRPKGMEPDYSTIFVTNPDMLRWLVWDMLAAANHLEKEQEQGESK